MFCWEITKYNPAYRNKQGHYLIDEWTEYSDVGKKFSGIFFSFDEYEKVEKQYIKAIQLFVEKLNIKTFRLQFLQKMNFEFDQYATSSMKNLYKSLSKDTIITRDMIEDFFKLIFRDYVSALPRSVDMIITFDDDYYLTIGTSEECLDTIEEIKKMGLFPRRLDYYEAIGQYHDGDSKDTCSA